MPPIFLNYRKVHGQGHASAIRLMLEQVFGPGAVFQDYESVVGGEDWTARVPRAVQECQVLLVLVHGNDWLELGTYKRKRRLFDPEDWVRKEIALALQAGKLILPILHRDVAIWPGEADVPEVAPEGLEPFFRLQGYRYDPDQPEALIDALKKRLDGLLQPAAPATAQAPDLLADFPLPDSSYHDLCFSDNPYPGIAHFTGQTAALLFGRDREIWELYYEYLLKLDPGRVLLLHGASGVGKSSLLSGGLFPRLARQGWAAVYARRSKAMPLAELFDQQIAEVQAQSGSPRLVLLDQVEEMITDPGQPGEVAAFFDRLGTLGQSDLKVVLGFRKEYLYEVKKALLDRRIRLREFPLHALDAAGIRRAIRGVFDTPAVREQFSELRHATLDPALVEALVQDISRDDKSHIAPLLQYQLQSLYHKAREAATASGKPLHLDLAAYQQQAASSLASFLEAEKLAALGRAFPEEMRIGLIDDLLYYFSTPELTAATHSKSDLWARYAHLSGGERFGRLVQALVDQYLLLHHKPEGLPETYRLAHDALARIVRQRYENSDRPGQQAAFIVRAKEKLSLDKVGFSETDIAIIKAGRVGMEKVPPALVKVLKDDVRRYAQQRKKRFDLAFATAQTDYDHHLRFNECLNNLRLAAREGIKTDKVAGLLSKLSWVFAFLKDEAGLAGCRELNGGDLPEINESAMLGCFFPTMKPVPGGSYDMGSGEGYDDEKPVHRVTVSSFEMSDTSVTCWQYGLYCLATGQDLPHDSGFGRADRPVVNVSWYEAIRYCHWLSERHGFVSPYSFTDKDAVEVDWEADGYRLPTEAEWEYAAREGGRKVRFGNGQDTAHASEMNYDYQNPYNNKPYITPTNLKAQRQTNSVYHYESNALGLYDMSGNVYDWCWDCWSEGDYYRSSEDTTDPRGPETSESGRVVRGGSWAVNADYCRSSYRNMNHPLDQFNNIGFRIVQRLIL
ncbi:MAG: SUMF1/EgtB/PvdO family nonheme iron enzyme [Bacteroidia bacterium]|nr:SUMF1/EgtB/PvdO family nonheme iron enzyme [Bacteroidia bacterium]